MPLIEAFERVTERTVTLDLTPLPTCTPEDPFGIDHDCLNPCGHHYVQMQKGCVVCVYCAKVPWP